VRARRAKARERLPSYREPTSRNPQAVHRRLFREPAYAYRFAFYPSAPRVSSATDFLPASALSIHQQVLRPPSGEDARCVQPMSATRTNCVHSHLARSRLALATFAARTSHGVLGSVRHDRGTGRFTTSEDRFGGSSSSAEPVVLRLTTRNHERGRLFPTARMRSSL